MKKNTKNINKNTRSNDDEIAIVGMACRFPGANDCEEFWQNLEKGANSIGEIPPQRWSVEKYYSQDPDEPNKSISKWGGFIEGVDLFDADFFAISPREAQRMDPQQRIILELSWSCLEDAGYSPKQLSGSPVGVFMGICNYDYDGLQHRHENNIDGHSATGTWVCMVPNRISSYFNFSGPSIPIDTACSSSLVAIHQGANAIKQSECEMALVGGVSFLLTPTRYIQMSQQGMLSPVGQCKTFDSKADGYVRGEGAGVILLKRYSKAIADGDRIYAVIKGSAVNHGGKARTLTSPNVYAQAKVVRAALEKANLPPERISYIEAHGTGTPLGDPIEINGLLRAFRQGGDKNSTNYCGLGTVKTNIGHLEGAAGIAGIIKVLLAMKHGKLPKIVNFEELNPRIKLEGSPFYIVREAREWQRQRTPEGQELPRCSGVSSFGIGGTNAHVILEEGPSRVKTANVSDVASATLRERPVHLLTLSAKTPKALSDLVSRYRERLEGSSAGELADLCYSANTGRAVFKHRLAAIASNSQELKEKLEQFLSGAEAMLHPQPCANGLFSGQVSGNNGPPKVAFLFTGQGSQYVNMGRQLYETQPVFREAIARCDAILSSELERPLLEILYPPEETNGDLLDQTAYTQPALFAIEYALAQLWQSWGIKPDAVMGHSVGEYVAATVAGVFGLEDGLKLIAARGRLMQQLPSGGGMVALMASESVARRLISSYGEKVAIAAINGPNSTVISGEAEAIEAIVENVEQTSYLLEGVRHRRLQVSHAFHSHLMEPMLAEFEKIAGSIAYRQPQITTISNLTGTKADESIATASYWTAHVRQPVRFASGMEALQELGYGVFLEVGPKPILLGMGRQCLASGTEKLWLPSLRPGVEDWQQMFSSLAQLYVGGVEPDWYGCDRDYQRQKVTLPTYPFQRRRYWLESSDLGNGEWGIENRKESVFANTKYSILEKLEQATFFNEKLELLKSHFQLQVALVMGLDSSELPETTKGFAEMGMDSLMAVELKKRLESSLAIPLSPTLAFNYPNIEVLSEYIIKEFFGDSEEPKQQNILVGNLAAIQAMSEQELEASLEREIAELEKLLLKS